LAIRHTGMVFIRQEVAAWFQAELRSGGKAAVWHTVPYRPTSSLAKLPV